MDSNPRSPGYGGARFSSAGGARRDRCHPGTPIVRVDEFGERFPHARRAFHMDKSRRRARDRLPRLRISGGAFFAFSATLEICRDDRICHQERMPNSGQKRTSLISAETSLIARFNSLQGRKKFPVRVRRELARKKLISCAFRCLRGARKPGIGEIPCIFPASREFGISETSSQLTLPSSGESSANLTWLHGIARRGRSPGPFFVGMRLIPPMGGGKLTDGGPRSLSRNQ